MVFRLGKRILDPAICSSPFLFPPWCDVYAKCDSDLSTRCSKSSSFVTTWRSVCTHSVTILVSHEFSGELHRQGHPPSSDVALYLNLPPVYAHQMTIFEPMVQGVSISQIWAFCCTCDSDIREFHSNLFISFHQLLFTLPECRQQNIPCSSYLPRWWSILSVRHCMLHRWCQHTILPGIFSCLHRLIPRCRIFVHHTS